MKAIIKRVDFIEEKLHIAVDFFLTEGDQDYHTYFREPDLSELNAYYLLAHKIGLLKLVEKVRQLIGKTSRPLQLFPFTTFIVKAPARATEEQMITFIQNKMKDFTQEQKIVVTAKTWKGKEITDATEKF